MKNTQLFLGRVQSFIFTHKVWSIIITVLILFIGYKIVSNRTSTEIRYVTSTAVKGTVVVSISGSGQVEASNSIDLKSKISGTITSVNVKSGQAVKKGQTLFAVDAQDAQKALRDAKLNLEIAQNDLTNTRLDYENTKIAQNLALSNMLISLNSGVTAVPDNTNTNTNIVTLSGSYNSTEQGRYTLEGYACQKSFCINYSGLESGSFAINLNVPEPLGTRGLYANFSSFPHVSDKWYVDIPSPTSTTYLSNLKSYTEKQESVKEAIQTAAQAVTSKELAVKQRENALIDTEQLLSNYYVSAPFDGTVASVVGKVGDIASGTIGTIITKENIATITLNEVDVSKINLGQKATLTFDAIDGLSIAGEVVEIDGIGTINQGVVSYKTKISFATNDPRVKPGMSVSASVIISVSQDVLTVPSSAVKTKNGASYVEVFDTALASPVAGVQGSVSTTLPRQQTVEVGASNDSTTVITSGITEGNIVVTKTITAIAAATSSAPSLLGSGRSSIGGGAVRNATGR